MYDDDDDEDTDNRASALQIARGLVHRLKRHELWPTNGLKLDRSFHPPSDNNVFLFVAGLHTHTSDHRTQPNFATWYG